MDTPDSFTLLTGLLQAIIFGLLAGLLVWPLLLLAETVVENMADWFGERRRRRISHAEADLDARQAELRRTILSLAEQLAAEREEASRQMIHAAFLASGKAPPPS